jgi:hypothetical protein
MFNEDIMQLFQQLGNVHWAFLRGDWPIVKKEKRHRTEIKDIPGIENVKSHVFQHLGYIPVFFFLSILFGNKDFPGPYRGVEKGLLILYHLLTGASMAQMGQFIPTSSFNSVYVAFYSKQKEWLESKLDECLEKMFSNVKIRVMCANLLNPDEFKHITMMIDGHDSRATYINATDRSQYYSYKLKKSGFRTQVGMDINGMILFVSKAAPCGVNNDGSMLVSLNLAKLMSKFDVVALDGGYTLFIGRVLELNHHLQAGSFVTPIRKSRGVNLSDEEVLYNQVFGGFRSAIESRFGEIGHLFRRFNGNSVIRVADESAFTLQLKLACVLSNMKNFVAKMNIQHTEHHTYWMQPCFDYYNGSSQGSSVYDVVDCLSIEDRRNQKEAMATIQQQMLSLDLEDNAGENGANDVEDMQQDDGPEHHEVEHIIQHRLNRRGVMQFKVKWKGFDSRHNSWIDQDAFDAGPMIDAYMANIQ